MSRTTVDSQTKDGASGKPTKRVREPPRKSVEKNVDNVLKALECFGTMEEKFGAMCQKYAEMFNDQRMLQSAVKQAEKKNSILQKEKEQLQAEHSKAILTRSRLENLCRELQRQNKAVKEECMLKMREEGEKKREVAAKFHSMLSEIGSLLAQNNDKNAKLRDDNLDMSNRLKSVCDQFEKKEQHVENLAKQMQLEMQLADAKLAKARMEMDIEKETLEKEKHQLLIELAEYKRKVCEMKAAELSLREEITMYSEKYDEFHKALLQSNSSMGEFKREMARMTKHINRLEKEIAMWKSHYDKAQRTLAEVTEGKIRSDEALALSQRRLVALQGICRGLQEQCRQLRDGSGRNSQCDEDYKQLEAQIKEVERADNLDNKPCPRKISSETPVEERTQKVTTVNGCSSECISESSMETETETGELSVQHTPSEVDHLSENICKVDHLNNEFTDDTLNSSDLGKNEESQSVENAKCNRTPENPEQLSEECIKSLVNHIVELSLVKNLPATEENITSTHLENESGQPHFINENVNLQLNSSLETPHHLIPCSNECDMPKINSNSINLTSSVPPEISSLHSETALDTEGNVNLSIHEAHSESPANSNIVNGYSSNPETQVETAKPGTSTLVNSGEGHCVDHIVQEEISLSDKVDNINNKFMNNISQSPELNKKEGPQNVCVGNVAYNGTPVNTEDSMKPLKNHVAENIPIADGNTNSNHLENDSELPSYTKENVSSQLNSSNESYSSGSPAVDSLLNGNSINPEENLNLSNNEALGETEDRSQNTDKVTSSPEDSNNQKNKKKRKSKK